MTTTQQSLTNVDELKDWGFDHDHCFHCGKHNDDIDNLLIQCGKCKKAYYCSMKCFNLGLPEHSKYCDSGDLPRGPRAFSGTPRLPRSNEEKEMEKISIDDDEKKRPKKTTTTTKKKTNGTKKSKSNKDLSINKKTDTDTNNEERSSVDVSNNKPEKKKTRKVKKSSSKKSKDGILSDSNASLMMDSNSSLMTDLPSTSSLNASMAFEEKVFIPVDEEKDPLATVTEESQKTIPDEDEAIKGNKEKSDEEKSNKVKTKINTPVPESKTDETRKLRIGSGTINEQSPYQKETVNLRKGQMDKRQYGWTQPNWANAKLKPTSKQDSLRHDDDSEKVNLRPIDSKDKAVKDEDPEMALLLQATEQEQEQEQKQDPVDNVTEELEKIDETPARDDEGKVDEEKSNRVKTINTPVPENKTDQTRKLRIGSGIINEQSPHQKETVNLRKGQMDKRQYGWAQPDWANAKLKSATKQDSLRQNDDNEKVNLRPVDTKDKNEDEEDPEMALLLQATEQELALENDDDNNDDDDDMDRHLQSKTVKEGIESATDPEMAKLRPGKGKITNDSPENENSIKLRKVVQPDRGNEEEKSSVKHSLKPGNGNIAKLNTSNPDVSLNPTETGEKKEYSWAKPNWAKGTRSFRTNYNKDNNDGDGDNNDTKKLRFGNGSINKANTKSCSDLSLNSSETEKKSYGWQKPDWALKGNRSLRKVDNNKKKDEGEQSKINKGATTGKQKQEYSNKEGGVDTDNKTPGSSTPTNNNETSQQMKTSKSGYMYKQGRPEGVHFLDRSGNVVNVIPVVGTASSNDDKTSSASASANQNKTEKAKYGYIFKQGRPDGIHFLDSFGNEVTVTPESATNNDDDKTSKGANQVEEEKAKSGYVYREGRPDGIHFLDLYGNQVTVTPAAATPNNDNNNNNNSSQQANQKVEKPKYGYINKGGRPDGIHFSDSAGNVVTVIPEETTTNDNKVSETAGQGKETTTRKRGNVHREGRPDGVHFLDLFGDAVTVIPAETTTTPTDDTTKTRKQRNVHKQGRPDGLHFSDHIEYDDDDDEVVVVDEANPNDTTSTKARKHGNIHKQGRPDGLHFSSGHLDYDDVADDEETPVNPSDTTTTKARKQGNIHKPGRPDGLHFSSGHLDYDDGADDEDTPGDPSEETAKARKQGNIHKPGRPDGLHFSSGHMDYDDVADDEETPAGDPSEETTKARKLGNIHKPGRPDGLHFSSGHMDYDDVADDEETPAGDPCEETVKARKLGNIHKPGRPDGLHFSGHLEYDNDESLSQAEETKNHDSIHSEGRVVGLHFSDHFDYDGSK